MRTAFSCIECKQALIDEYPLNAVYGVLPHVKELGEDEEIAYE